MNTDFLKNLDAAIDPATTSRREALRNVGRLGGAAALAVTPFFAMADKAFAAKTNTSAGSLARAHDVLNYALTLEYLEYYFYLNAVGGTSVVDPKVVIQASGVIPSENNDLFVEIRDNEGAHVVLLRDTILELTDPPGVPVEFTVENFDYTAGGAFDPFGDYQQFLLIAQGFEDTGVRAYKGQAGALQGTPYLTPALRIHSVEARHAAAVRRLRGNQGWIPFDQPGVNAAIAAVYGPGGEFPSEANTTQGGVELTAALTAYSAEQITEAFDEALDMGTVLGIANPFLA